MTETKPMRLYTGNWNDKHTFKALPISKDAPFLEFIFDPETKYLAIVGNFVKDGFTMMQKLDKEGHAIFTSDFKKGMGKFKSITEALNAAEAMGMNPYVMERVSIQNVNEYILTDVKEIEEYVERFCENSATFDWKQYVDAPVPQQITASTSPEGQMQALVNEGLSVVKE